MILGRTWSAEENQAMSEEERERGKAKVLVMVQRIAPGAEVSAFTLIPAVRR